MRLTTICCYFKKLSHVPGHTLKGKVRLYPYITDNMKRLALLGALREKQNLEILDNPYLTVDEERNSTKARRVERFMEMKEAQKDKNWLKHKYTSDYFDYWKKFKTWE